jgi:hypothetical protein
LKDVELRTRRKLGTKGTERFKIRKVDKRTSEEDEEEDSEDKVGEEDENNGG